MPNKEFCMANSIIIRDMLPEELDRVAALHDQIHALHVSGRPDIFVPCCEDSTGLMNWHAQQPNRVCWWLFGKARCWVMRWSPT